MLTDIIAFADRYKAIPMFMGGVLAFGTGSFKAHQLLMGDQGNAFLLEEQKRMAEHYVRPVEYYVEYHQITIEGKSREIKNGKLVTVFKMNSDVTRGQQSVRMTWRDTAKFRDKDGVLIERGKPCEQSFPAPGRAKPDCDLSDKNNWYQHQWWRAEMPKKDARSWEPWTYTQSIVPKTADQIQVCGFYEIQVYKGFIGNIDKIMNVCTKWYSLDKIERVAD